MTHLLDSSAWLAHLFAEAGHAQVTMLFEDSRNDVAISALSIPEVFFRLKAMNLDTHWSEVWERYSQIFSKVLPVDDTIAHQAVRLRLEASERLPTIDSLIAAAALTHQLTLVHRDPHFDAILNTDLLQLQLPGK